MPTFTYTGTDTNGKKVQGNISATNLQEVVNKLRTEHITILDINEEKSRSSKKRSGRVSSKDLELFSRQLASLISARIPIVRSLSILAAQTERRYFKDVIIAIQKNIEEGNTLADSFARYPNIFSSLFINMINVGEFSGNLDVMLERLASHIESYNSLIKKVQSAMMYPIGIIVVATVLLIIIFTFVIPGFQKIFENLGGHLPVPTQILINISEFIRKYIIALVLGGIGFGFFAKYFSKTPRGKKMSEDLRTKMPVLGDMYHKMVIARFTKTLATLVKSGVSILNALEIAGSTSGSNRLSQLMITIRDSVSRGEKLANCLEKSAFFPLMTTNMIAVGEESGNLGEMLEKVAELYDRDVNATAAGLLSLLEPMIIVFLGVIIGGIVICLFLPIVKMHELIK